MHDEIQCGETYYIILKTEKDNWEWVKWTNVHDEIQCGETYYIILKTEKDNWRKGQMGECE